MRFYFLFSMLPVVLLLLLHWRDTVLVLPYLLFLSKWVHEHSKGNTKITMFISIFVSRLCLVLDKRCSFIIGMIFLKSQTCQNFSLTRKNEKNIKPMDGCYDAQVNMLVKFCSTVYVYTFGGSGIDPFSLVLRLTEVCYHVAAKGVDGKAFNSKPKRP